MTDGFLCGWRVRSELHLPELAPWAGDDRAPDIIIRFGEVPSRLEDPVLKVRQLEVDRNGRCLLRPRYVGDFLVNGPNEVIVAPLPGVSAGDIRVFLLGSIFGFICHLRGLFPLHASSVTIAGKAIAFCGPTGAGKSTTASHLASRGHGLIADDVTVIDAKTKDALEVLPAFPRLKLTRASLDALKLSPDGVERDRLGEQEKYHYSAIKSFSTAAVPLGGIFLLQRADAGVPEECRRLTRSAEIVAMLSQEVFRPHVATALGREQFLIDTQGAIAGKIPIWRLLRRFDLADIDRWLEQIEALASA